MQIFVTRLFTLPVQAPTIKTLELELTHPKGTKLMPVTLTTRASPIANEAWSCSTDEDKGITRIQVKEVTDELFSIGLFGRLYEMDKD